MQFQDETVLSPSTGLQIYRRTSAPRDTKSRGVVLMLHGLGDHQGRHDEAAELFVKHGFTIFGFDWPGNGKSEGKRGDIPSVEVACYLMDEALDWIREETGSENIGLYAHSTGGFFALRYFGLLEKNPFRWIWLSSPLINPRFEKSTLLQKSVPILADFFPTMTVSTGTSLEKCHHIDPAVSLTDKLRRLEGLHRRVSLRLAASFLAHDDKLDQAAEILSDPTVLLLTQGDEDQICPAEFSRPIFDKIELTNKCYVLLKGLRHEAFHEPDNAEFLELVNDWVADL